MLVLLPFSMLPVFGWGRPRIGTAPGSSCLRGGRDQRERAVVDNRGLERSDQADLHTRDGGLGHEHADGCPGVLRDEQGVEVTDDDLAGVQSALTR